MTTLVTPVKPVPVITTVPPTGALVGVKLEIVGGGMTVNVGPVTVPSVFVTATGPVVPNCGT